MAEAEVRPLKAAAKLGEEVGASGLRQQGGVIQEEFLRQLQGKKGREVFREMSDNDPVVGALLFGVEMLIRQVAWRVDPSPESATPDEDAAFAESCLHDMNLAWEDTLASILTMLPFGWSYFEVVYKLRHGANVSGSEAHSKYDDGKVGWRKLALRAQDTLARWDFDDEGGIQGMVQQAPPDYQPVTIPIEKALLFRTTSAKENPEGRSILRNAYRPWYFKKRIEEIEGVGIERDLAGLPIAYVPARLLADDASPGDKQVLAEIQRQVENIKRDEQEGVVFPSVYDEHGHQLYKLELLTTGGRRQFDTDAIIARYDQRITMTALADLILLGHEKVGTQALATTKADLFGLAIGAWADSIASVFNGYGFPRLWALNGWDPAVAPTLSHEDIRDVDLEVLGGFIERAAGATILTPDASLEAWIRDQAGLPPLEGGSEEL